jgi:deazaflavin-dependent oxidoreductase (nitroreductase family)
MSNENDANELPNWIREHLDLYARDPQKGHDWDSTVVGGPGVLPVLLLTTTGRKSGARRALPLIYKKVGEGFVIIASKGGAPSHPAWYLNLVAEPDCEIQVAHDRFRVRARVAEGVERDSLWQQLVEIYPPYTDYQKATAREIPVVVLDPVS